MRKRKLVKSNFSHYSAQCTPTIAVADIFSAIDEYLDDDLQDNIRRYITCVKESEYSLPEDVQKKVQEDFVEMRQSSGGKVSADDLHACLTLARLLTFSHGDTALSLGLWERAKQMERERTSRLPRQ